MTRYAVLSLALLAAAPVAAQPDSQSGGATQPATGSTSPKLQNLIQNCDAHKFETTIVSTVDGKPHDSKVKLCGNEGQSDADWIRTLHDAIDKLSVNTEMPAATRDQIIGAIKLEIARLNGQVTTDLSATGGLPPGRSMNRSSQSLSSDYSVLPPLTAAPAPPPHLLAPSTASGEVSSAAPSGTAPPPAIPEPKASALIDNAPAATSPAAAPPPAKVAIADKPKLAFECIDSDFPGGGPCVSLSRDTILSIKAGQPLPDDVSLRFVRRGEARAEISVGALNKGQSVRLQIPSEVCSGVVSTEITVEVTRSGQTVDRQGPYLLRC